MYKFKCKKSDTGRKLASIRKISDIQPIPNADAIEKAVVDGWEVVVAKKDNFKVGDLVIYIEIDSIVPKTEGFEFLKKKNYRIRTIKMRGQISQGLILPLSFLDTQKRLFGYKLGDDVTEILGIKKYDPQGEKELSEANNSINSNFVINLGEGVETFIISNIIKKKI